MSAEPKRVVIEPSVLAKVEARLRDAHVELISKCPTIFKHARSGYIMGGRGALLVRFDSLHALKQFNLGLVEEHNVLFFELLQLGELGYGEINEAIKTYNPDTEFVLVAATLLPVQRQWVFAVSKHPHNVFALVQSSQGVLPHLRRIVRVHE